MKGQGGRGGGRGGGGDELSEGFGIFFDLLRRPDIAPPPPPPPPPPPSPPSPTAATTGRGSEGKGCGSYHDIVVFILTRFLHILAQLSVAPTLVPLVSPLAVSKFYERCMHLLLHEAEDEQQPVSYTHLTLPTICSV